MCCAVHEPAKQLLEVQRMLTDELPEDNYNILKYIMQLLVQVADFLSSFLHFFYVNEQQSAILMYFNHEEITLIPQKATLL